MTTGAGFSVPKRQFLTTTGAPNAAGSLYVYQTGTTTPVTIYADGGLVTPITNPITLDANGVGQFYYNGQVNLKLVSNDASGGLIETIDPVYPVGAAAGFSTESTLASATTTDLGTASSSIIDITGTTTITGFGSTANLNAPLYFLRFTGALTLTYNATSLILPGQANITTAAGDTCVAQYMGSGNWKVLSYSPISGQPLAGATINSGFPNDFRLTLTTAVPVTTGDVTGATTIYCSPYTGNRIALYDGSANWNIVTSAEFSKALGTLADGTKPYDIFCYNNAGTATLEFLVWTSTTARATALTLQNGILVKSGATTRRYLGTFMPTATTTTEDSYANRYLWNYYNRRPRAMKAMDATASWAYTTATWREARAQTTNQLNFVIGVSEDIVTANVAVGVGNSGGTSTDGAVAIGLDATNAPAAACLVSATILSAYPTSSLRSSYEDYIAIGQHYLSWLEISKASGTTTWLGSGSFGSGSAQSGIAGTILA